MHHIVRGTDPYSNHTGLDVALQVPGLGIRLLVGINTSRAQRWSSWILVLQAALCKRFLIALVSFRLQAHTHVSSSHFITHGWGVLPDYRPQKAGPEARTPGTQKSEEAEDPMTEA